MNRPRYINLLLKTFFYTFLFHLEIQNQIHINFDFYFARLHDFFFFQITAVLQDLPNNCQCKGKFR